MPVTLSIFLTNLHKSSVAHSMFLLHFRALSTCSTVKALSIWRACSSECAAAGMAGPRAWLPRGEGCALPPLRRTANIHSQNRLPHLGFRPEIGTWLFMKLEKRACTLSVRV
jgi:hypothetical protein